MSRYIDAYALINKLDERCDAICQWTKKEREVMCGACPMATAFDAVEDFPTADVVEVKHGNWIKNDNGTYSCSVCQSWIPNEQHYYANYCLHCGARMGDSND